MKTAEQYREELFRIYSASVSNRAEAARLSSLNGENPNAPFAFGVVMQYPDLFETDELDSEYFKPDASAMSAFGVQEIILAPNWIKYVKEAYLLRAK